MGVNSSFTVINNFFSITHVHNYGAAFSIFYGNRLFLITVSLLCLFLFYYFILRKSFFSRFDVLTYGLLLGGVFGNLFDRIFNGYVIDYLDFCFLGYDFPIFNLADCFIVISMVLIIADSLRSGKNEVRSN